VGAVHNFGAKIFGKATSGKLKRREIDCEYGMHGTSVVSIVDFTISGEPSGSSTRQSFVSYAFVFPSHI
jgi:hypothetical protein